MFNIIKLNACVSVYFYCLIHIISFLKDMGILVNSHNKKRYLKKDQYFERKQFKDKGTNRNRTKVPRDRPERVQVGSDNGQVDIAQVDIAPLQQAVASFVKEEEDPYFGCPPSDIVDCDDGFLRGSGTPTCQAECDGKCCVGTTTDPNACERFTGKVCKDKKSCIGRDACVDADIGLVVGGCTGDFSCKDAYIKHGVIRGCISPRACNEAGAFKAGSGNSGYVGRIKDGCVGVAVCAYMGYGFSSDAFVGFVDNGCVGGGSEGTCYKLGYDGRVGFIRNACKQFNACNYLAYDNDGYVGSIERACIGTYKYVVICWLPCFPFPCLCTQSCFQSLTNILTSFHLFDYREGLMWQSSILWWPRWIY